jgi:hypothetical protein
VAKRARAGGLGEGGGHDAERHGGIAPLDGVKPRGIVWRAATEHRAVNVVKASLQPGG